MIKKNVIFDRHMNKLPFRSLFLFLSLILMLFHVTVVTDGAKKGLILWYNSVVPALFPFMVLSGLIVSSGGIEQLMSPIYHILHPILGISRNGCYVLVSGLLCGYPMGAKTCAEFLHDERLSIKESKFLMAICNHPSPMFVLGYVFPWFSDHITVPELLFCVYTPFLILTFAAKVIYQFPDKEKSKIKERVQKRSDTDDTIFSSIEVLCKIGGYLVLFSILVEMINHIIWIPERMKLYLIGLMEMTTGIKECALLDNWKSGYMTAIFALTFGGFSGLFQTKSVLDTDKKKAGLSIRPYVFWKLAHAVLSAGLAYLICNF